MKTNQTDKTGKNMEAATRPILRIKVSRAVSKPPVQVPCSVMVY